MSAALLDFYTDAAQGPGSAVCSAADARPFRMILPKKDRLRDEFNALCAQAGLRLEKADPTLDYGRIVDERQSVSGVEGLVQRSADALDTLSAGIADLAVVGFDSFSEFRNGTEAKGQPCGLDIVTTLDFSRCGLFIAAPQTLKLENPSDLEGLRIATSYPETLKAWLKASGVSRAKVVAREGGVEDTVRLGIADAICDLVQTGRSLASNGLKPGPQILESCAVLIRRGGDWTPEQEATARILAERLQSAPPKPA